MSDFSPQPASAAQRPPRRLSRRRFLQACAASTLAGTATYGYARTYGVTNLKVEHVTVPIPHLAPAWQNTRLVHLSDLHHGCTDLSLITRALGMARDLAPDFLLITGDFIDNKYANVDTLAAALRPITGRIPPSAVPATTTTATTTPSAAACAPGSRPPACACSATPSSPPGGS
jgi:hypothetical protein